MKKIMMSSLIVSLFVMGALDVSAAPSVSILEAKLARRSEMIEKKLSIIQEKAGVEIKEKVAEKIKLKEEKIAKEKKAVAEKKAAEEKAAADKKAAEQQAAANAEVQAQTQAGTENAAAEVTSGASQSGREIGETNRAYGQQLSDPNLSQDERQAIIQEKKNYNQGRR